MRRLCCRLLWRPRTILFVILLYWISVYVLDIFQLGIITSTIRAGSPLDSTGGNGLVPSDQLPVAVSRTKPTVRQLETPEGAHTVGKALIEVVAAVDGGFLQQLMVMMTSLHRHHAQGELRLNILTHDLDPETKDLLTRSAKDCCGRLVLRLVAVEHAIGGRYRGLSHVSMATMLRLQIPAVLPDVARAIYLDSDLVVTAPLRGMWEGHHCKGEWASAESPGICARTPINPAWTINTIARSKCVPAPMKEQVGVSGRIFNAGVLLLDLSVLRTHDFVNKTVDLMQQCDLHDQEILNLYSMGMYAELSPAWNALVQDTDDYHKITDPVVIHYNAQYKPWKAEYLKRLGNDVRFWTEYAKESPTLPGRPLKQTRAEGKKDPAPRPTRDGMPWAWNSEPLKSAPADIIVVWSSVRTLHAEVVQVAARLVEINKPRRVRGLCASQQCVDALRSVQVEAGLINIHELVLQLPLRQWFFDGPVHKVWGGPAFEGHFHNAIVLAALYHYGGLFWNLLSQPLAPLPAAAFEGEWSVGFDDGQTGLWSLCRFRQYSNAIYTMSSFFVESYVPSARGVGTPGAVSMDYSKVQAAGGRILSWNPAWGDCSRFLKARAARPGQFSVGFGTLSLDLRTQWLEKHGNHGCNLGDEMQSFPGLQFLPKLDAFVERDDVRGFKGVQDAMNSSTPQVAVTFLNAWFGTPQMTWPPSPWVQPVLNAVHLEKEVVDKFVSKSAIDYLHKHGGLGARDSSTLDIFASRGVQAEISGCMTLLLHGLPWKFRRNTYMVDVPKPIMKAIGIPKTVIDESTHLSHKYVEQDRFDKHVRFGKAFELLKLYQTARLVITSRLHVALPNVAMGTPTIFVKHKGMMGGFDKKHDRVDGNLMKLFHLVDLTTNASANLAHFDFAHPPRNPSHEVYRQMRASLFKRICRQPYLITYFQMFSTTEERKEIEAVEGCRA